MVIQILSGSERQDVSSSAVFCYNCDVSQSGMCIELESPLQLDSEVDLWVSDGETEERYYLRGHVCWCQPDDTRHGQFQIGIELEDVFATDYARWIALIRRISTDAAQALS